MATNIDICNSALDKLGVEPISSFTDGTKAANLCSRYYNRMRTRLLTSHWWNFAIVRDNWTADATAPEWGFDTQYSIPGNVLRFLRPENNNLDYRIEGEKLLIDNSDSTINVMYIDDVDDVDLMGSTFQEGLAYLIASELAFPMLQNKGLAESMYNKYKIEIQDVRTVDSQISSNAGMQADRWLGSRRVAGRTSGDLSYYWN